MQLHDSIKLAIETFSGDKKKNPLAAKIHTFLHQLSLFYCVDNTFCLTPTLALHFRLLYLSSFLPGGFGWPLTRLFIISCVVQVFTGRFSLK